ncbi:MAG: flagellar M-ring protein FliF [Nitrospinae bacterium]|nr:flagellar M-ring protein FliF [Nitrospinota bacterium]
MFKQLKDAMGQFANMFGDLPAGKKIGIIAFGVLILAGILITGYFSGAEDNTLLYANLSQEDALSISEKLKERKIQYKLENGGNAISVPAKDVYQLRLELAGEGLPSGGGVGFEIFDKASFGMTEFVQKLNYRRALQGELQRTINSIGTVQSSRVHISIPAKTLFDEEKQKATASVVLKLKGNKKLSKQQVDGIAHLVASSVEGLNSSDITIVDTSGSILSIPEEGEDEATKLSNKQMDFRKNYESDVERRIRTMLEKVVGAGKAIVRVSASMDFKQEQRTEESYDPDGQVARSEQRNEEKTTGAASPVGVAGVSSNLPETAGAQASAVGKPAESTKTNETINYEINKVVKTIVEPTSQVKKLSVAVMVDGKYKETKAQDGKISKEFQPISTEEKNTIQNLVRTAIGFDGNRQDLVTVESMQFDEAPLAEEAQKMDVDAQREYTLTMVKYAGITVAALAIFLFILRPLMKSMTQANVEAEELRALPQNIVKMEGEINKLGVVKEENVDYRKRVTEVISDNPQQAAELIRSWMRKAKA